VLSGAFFVPQEFVAAGGESQWPIHPGIEQDTFEAGAGGQSACFVILIDRDIPVPIQTTGKP
jgi:hypothetical protein